MDLSNVSVIVLSFNRVEELKTNLPRLSSYCVDYGMELVVCDNASNDGSREIISSFAGSSSFFHAVLSPENLGVAAGRNLGREHVTRRYVLHIDDDTIIDESQIAALRDLMAADAKIGAISPLVVHAQTGKLQNDCGPIQRKVTAYHGACHLVRRDAIDAVGPIDPECNFGGEEFDYSIRLKDAGYEVVYYPAVVVKHNNHLRKGQEGEWRRQRRVFNNLRLHFKHMRPATAAVFGLRFVAPHLASAAREGNFKLGARLIAEAGAGIRAGYRGHQVKQAHTLSFYTDPSARPDVGNVPLIDKAFCRGRDRFSGLIARLRRARGADA